METFEQKTLFLKKKFTFKENGVDIEFKDSDGEFSLFVHFDKILPRENIRIFTKKKKRVLRIGLLLAGLTFLRGSTLVNNDKNTIFAVILIALVIAAITYCYYKITLVKYYAIDMENNRRFQVLYNKLSKEAALDFIDELFERRKEFYRSEYSSLIMKMTGKKKLIKCIGCTQKKSLQKMS